MATIDAARAAPEPPVLDNRRRNVVFVTIMLGMLLAALDQTIVGTALPTIVADLGGAAHMSWVAFSSTDLGESFASPAGDSQCVLETAVARILRDTKADTMRRIVAESGTRLDVAGAWAVIQVDLATRHVGSGDLEAIASRRRMPPEVLEPVFDSMVADGLLTREGWVYAHTTAGHREADLIRAAWTEWLEQRVEQDIGRPPGTDLRTAVETIAKRLLTEDERAPIAAGSRS